LVATDPSTRFDTEPRPRVPAKHPGRGFRFARPG